MSQSTSIPSISYILSQDRKNRKIKTSEDTLFTLDQCKAEQEWNYSAPTLENKNQSYQQNTILTSGEKFQSVFYQKYPFLEKVNMANVLIAGGCVGDVITQTVDSGYSFNGKDLDIFLYGLTPEEANERIKELMTDIYTQVSSHLQHLNQEYQTKNKTTSKRYYNRWKLIRNQAAISMVCEDLRLVFQIIFRLYHNKAEILHGFDLGSSAVGFDGEQVWLTELSRFSYQYKCNIIDTTRRSTTYEGRIKKYFDRGFRIIIPELDIKKLSTKNHKYGLSEVCDLPYFAFSYSQVYPNRIIVKQFYLGYDYRVASDYSPMHIDEYGLFYHNLKNLLQGHPNVSAITNVFTTNILTKPVFLNEGHVIRFYDDLVRKVYDEHKLNVQILQQYYPDFPLPVVLATMQECLTPKGKVDKEVFLTYLTEITQQQKELSIAKIKSMKQGRIPWITQNPGTQLTSSLNPIMEKAEMWYGEYYLPLDTDTLDTPTLDASDSVNDSCQLI